MKKLEKSWAKWKEKEIEKKEASFFRVRNLRGSTVMVCLDTNIFLFCLFIFLDLIFLLILFILLF